MSKSRTYLTVQHVAITGQLLGGTALLLTPHTGSPVGFILSASQAEQLKSALPQGKK